MKGINSILPVKKKLINVYPFKELSGNVATIATKKPGKDVFGEEGTFDYAKEKAEPIVAFSRPPPMPPILGPLFVLSLLETWSRREKDE